MIYSNEIRGRYVILRSVCENDADFILSLRTDEKYNKFINATENDNSLQRIWIKTQQERQGDYYFLVMSITEEPIGLISLYNIHNETAECGRWISKGNAFENLETVKLIHDFGFLTVGIKQIYTQTVRENIKVVNFWKRLGGYFDGYVTAEAYILYKNVVDSSVYINEITSNIEKLLYK